MIIAIDGPAASGKGTLARRLAAHYGLNHLDTGSLYRAVALAVLDAGGDPKDEENAERAARALDSDLLDSPSLRDDGVGQAAIVAAQPRVRAALLDYQRRIASTAPGAVLDGRDIGTVVCPQADVKLFIVAESEIRARRRMLELRRAGVDVAYEQVLADLARRDERDSARADAPLRAAPDAHLLDTSKLDIEAAFRAAVEIVDRNRETRGE